MTQATPRFESLPIVNAYDIWIKDMPPTIWFVDSILHEGASLLSGDPKVGKSFFALQIAVAVAGDAETVFDGLKIGKHGRVLYLSLDDGSERRAKDRLTALGATEGAIRNIDFVYDRSVPGLAGGLLELVEKAVREMNYVMVVIDTLGAISNAGSKRDVYGSEYQETIPLQKLAQAHGICLLILHHTNKGEGLSAVGRSSGSHGRTGAVDSVLLLARPEGAEGQLLSEPRDGEKTHWMLTPRENGGWENARRIDSPFQVGRRQTKADKEIEDCLALSPKTKAEVAAILDIKEEAARKRLVRCPGVMKGDDNRYSWTPPS